jgi:hypothetical protein
VGVGGFCARDVELFERRRSLGTSVSLYLSQMERRKSKGVGLDIRGSLPSGFTNGKI